MYKKKSYQEYLEEAKNKIRELLRKERAMYVTELKVRLDGSVDEKVRFWQWITYDALQQMHRNGELKRRPRRGKYYVGEEGVVKRGSEITFYYLAELTYADVADVVRKKLELVNQHASISSEVGALCRRSG